MKALTLVIPVLFLVSFSNNSSENVNIFDAIKNNQIQFTAISNGTHSGGSIIIEIEKLKNIKSIIIPSGTRFKSEFDEDQDLINIDDEIIVLNSNSTKHTLNGFCVQQHNMSPTNESQFTISKETNENLVETAKYLNKKGFSDDIKQTTLWCVSNKADVSGIYQNGNKQVEKLREYVCSLTGKENVWYNSNPTYSIDENRNIIQETTKIEGLLSYTVTRTGNMKMEVCKENGEVLRTLGGSTPISNLGEYRFNFSVKVKGWKSGKYSVQLKIGDEVIHKEVFEIA
jgi:hypothetical protein